MQEKIFIMDKIFPKEDQMSSSLIKTQINQNKLREGSEEIERPKTLKVLSFETKDGVFVRGKIIDPDNMKDIKKKFYPLGYGELIKQNRKKIKNFPSIDLSNINEKDPFQWGREQALIQNEEKIGIRRFYTRKLSVVSIARKEVSGVNMHFQKEKQNLNLYKSLDLVSEGIGSLKGFEPSFKLKKHPIFEKKAIIPLNLLSIDEFRKQKSSTENDEKF